MSPARLKFLTWHLFSDSLFCIGDAVELETGPRIAKGGCERCVNIEGNPCYRGMHGFIVQLVVLLFVPEDDVDSCLQGGK